jgi:hypothetical protein
VLPPTTAVPTVDLAIAAGLVPASASDAGSAASPVTLPAAANPPAVP